MSDAPVADAATTITVRDARAGDAPVLAHLMYTEITWGRLRDFGMGFLTLLHRAFCTSRHAVCVVAEVDGRVVGYVASAVHLQRFYREFVIAHGVVAAIMVLPKLFRRNMLATLWKGLTYHKDPGPDGPQCEILAFAVSSGFGGRGIGTKLVNAALAHLRERGVDAVRIGTVTEGNQAALTAYSRCGFKVVKTQGFYGDSKVHVMEYRFDSTPQ